MGDIFDFQFRASQLADSLILSYENFTDDPARSLLAVTEFLPALGSPAQVENVPFVIHGKKSIIKNFNAQYSSKLRRQDRAQISMRLQHHAVSIAHFHYALD